MLHIYKDLCYYKICYVLAVWPLAIESLVSMFFLLITVLPLYFLLIGKRWYDALSCVHFLWLKSIGVLTVILPSDRVSACLLILVFSQDWDWNGLDYIHNNFSFCQGLCNISCIYSTLSMKSIYMNITNSGRS